MKNTLLTIDNLSKSFGEKSALKNISFQLKEGEILFLLGPSGCGKTTLLRIIAGFEKANEGIISLRKKVIFSNNINIPTQERKLGYVVQEGVLFPHLNVYRNIAYGLGNGKGKSVKERERIEKIMSLVGINDLAWRFPHELSGGQQQRVALARALAPHPQLILFDEPFSALDEHLRNQIRQDILDILRKNRHSAIFVTHDREEALRYADRIAIIQDGQILQMGTPRELYWKPQSLNIAQFIGEGLIFNAEYDFMDKQIISPLGKISHFIPDSKINKKGKLFIRPKQFILSNIKTEDNNVLEGIVLNIKEEGILSTLTIRINDTTIELENKREIRLEVNMKIYLYIEGNIIYF